VWYRAGVAVADDVAAAVVDAGCRGGRWPPWWTLTAVVDAGRDARRHDAQLRQQHAQPAPLRRLQ